MVIAGIYLAVAAGDEFADARQSFCVRASWNDNALFLRRGLLLGFEDRSRSLLGLDHRAGRDVVVHFFYAGESADERDGSVGIGKFRRVTCERHDAVFHRNFHIAQRA